MKKFSQELLAETLKNCRKVKGMTQADVANATGINRSMIGRIESKSYMPSIDQLQTLAETLEFDISSLLVEDKKAVKKKATKKYNIAVAGTGYVGLSIATL